MKRKSISMTKITHDQELSPKRTTLLMVKIMKWMGGITAILTFIFGIHQFWNMVSDYHKQRRHVTELIEVGKVEQEAGHYFAAWTSLEKAAQIDKDNQDVKKLQEDIAMKWVDNIRTSQGKGTFTDIVNKLLPTLSRGIVSSDGSRKADLIAHLGWADFLRQRDGMGGLEPEKHYRKALEIDPDNVYAHTMLGHLILWRHGQLEDSRQHFSSALASGRERHYVRTMQLAALFNMNNSESDRELIRVANEMRINNEHIPPDIRRKMVGMNCFNFSSRIRSADPSTGKFLMVLSPLDELKTFQWLFNDLNLDSLDQLLRDYCLASFHEAAGHYATALEAFKSLRSRLSTSGSPIIDSTDAAIKRISEHINKESNTVVNPYN
jgi:tetratricopeptide (TPR) repeat protein